MENHNISIPPFYVGQEVVAIKDGTTLKRGKDYVVTGIFFPCKCGKWRVTVGIVSSKSQTKCYDCGFEHVNETNERQYSSKLFAPKIEIKEFISMKQLAEQQLELIGVN